jgi:hypothetical protein
LKAVILKKAGFWTGEGVEPKEEEEAEPKEEVEQRYEGVEEGEEPSNG